MRRLVGTDAYLCVVIQACRAPVIFFLLAAKKFARGPRETVDYYGWLPLSLRECSDALLLNYWLFSIRMTRIYVTCWFDCTVGSRRGAIWLRSEKHRAVIDSRNRRFARDRQP